MTGEKRNTTDDLPTRAARLKVIGSGEKDPVAVDPKHTRAARLKKIGEAAASKSGL